MRSETSGLYIITIEVNGIKTEEKKKKKKKKKKSASQYLSSGYFFYEFIFKLKLKRKKRDSFKVSNYRFKKKLFIYFFNSWYFRDLRSGAFYKIQNEHHSNEMNVYLWQLLEHKSFLSIFLITRMNHLERKRMKND